MHPVITFDHVRKEYVLQEDRTLKELVPNLLSGKPWAKKHTVFSDLSFVITQGETVGIVGKNGAGKSTILKLIAGVTYPDKGRVIVDGSVTPLIELGAGFHHELSGFENIYLNAAILGMHKKQVEKSIASIIEFSELHEYIHTPVKKYSTGMYMRLAFAIAIHMDSPILLIDEVLAVGDEAFQKKCLKYLHTQKEKHDRTIIFVSHDEEAVKSFCERALLLNHGELVADSTPHKVFEAYHKIENIPTL
ncbi:MAG TPA: ABC transporter ATP-binding protein [Patescibacteria group bacterium]|nr:ABC transporter ATP-binding protein [Patescibacteria group bacterium]